MNHKPVIHVVRDDKFINEMIRRFECVALRRQRYILPVRKKSVKHATHQIVERLSPEETKRVLSSRTCRAVIFHSLPNANIPLLRATHPSARVWWIGWGFDYYNTLLKPMFHGELLLPHTVQTLRDLPKKSIWTRGFSYAFRRLHHPVRVSAEISNQDYKRVDFFSPVLRVEHQLCSEANPHLNAAYLNWNYQSETNNHASQTRPTENANNILVGNSADPHNNHIDILERLRKVDRSLYDTIIAPLNYGNQAYADQVENTGRKMFGSKFRSLREWMPWDEYSMVIASCKLGVMGHIRQQAAGNILQLASNGVAVYMQDKSPLYETLLRIGVAVRDIQTLPQWTSEPLTDDETRRNLLAAEKFLEAPPYAKTANALRELLE